MIFSDSALWTFEIAPVVLSLLAYAAAAWATTRTVPDASGARVRVWLAWVWALHLLALLAQFGGAAWLAQALGAGQAAAFVPRFGFAPALSMTSWLVLTIYAIEQQLWPRMRALTILCGVGAASVALAALFPGRALDMAHAGPLALHLALGIASYGLLAAAVVHATLMAQAERRIRQGAETGAGMPLLMLERLTFRFVSAGFALLSATLLAGWVFGDTLYGQALWWNHKTVFSILAWVAFAGLLIGRLKFGLRGKNAIRTIYAGAILLLLAYAGSRFVLEVILSH